MKYIIILFLTLTSCTHWQQKYNDELEAEQSQTTSMLFNPRCTGDGSNDYLTAEFGERCGYLTYQVYRQLPEFNKNCKAKRLNSSECKQKFFEMYNAKLLLRYPNADVAKVVLWCKSEPELCNFSDVYAAALYEGHLIESQNDYTIAQSGIKRSEIKLRANVEASDRQRAIQQIFAPKPAVKCNTVQTITGYNTQCTQQ